MELEGQQDMTANEDITVNSNCYEKVISFKYLGSLCTNQNSIRVGIKCRLKAGINTFKYHVFAPMGRFQLELIYLYFPPSF